ncbi:hypothetical protein LLS1_01550 [Leifsonia sp. LS1]|nr:hypothetical protein LLS1_01550 [Leifsonia sp. LS1]
MRWHRRSFENLERSDVVEFYPNGVDPNNDDSADPWLGGPVEIHTEPESPGPLDGAPAGQMVRAGSQSYRVRSDAYTPWIREGGYRVDRLR